jgi:hypothetical protein
MSACVGVCRPTSFYLGWSPLESGPRGPELFVSEISNDLLSTLFGRFWIEADSGGIGDAIDSVEARDDRGRLNGGVLAQRIDADPSSRYDIGMGVEDRLRITSKNATVLDAAVFAGRLAGRHTHVDLDVFIFAARTEQTRMGDHSVETVVVVRGRGGE